MARTKKQTAPRQVTIEDLQALYLAASQEVQEQLCSWLVRLEGSGAKYVLDELEKIHTAAYLGVLPQVYLGAAAKGRLRREDRAESEERRALKLAGHTDAEVAKKRHVTVGAIRKQRQRQNKRQQDGRRKG